MYSIGAYAKNLIGDAESADECRRSVGEAMTDACLRCHDLQYHSYLICNTTCIWYMSGIDLQYHSYLMATVSLP